MSNLAFTYFELGRYQDALVLQEKTLEFRRRVLPENHPDTGVMGFCLLVLTWYLTRSVLGHSMCLLGNTYFALGRHQDALVLQEKTLELHRRILPENHPDTGVKKLCSLN
jgi:tetratricopeptide (TPR) repeat protein